MTVAVVTMGMIFLSNQVAGMFPTISRLVKGPVT